MADDGRDRSGHLGFFLLGALAGAAVAILLTPRTGRETRDLLADRGGDAARRAQEMAREAQERAGEWIEKGRERLEEQTQRLSEAFEAGREAMQEEIRKAGQTADT